MPSMGSNGKSARLIVVSNRLPVTLTKNDMSWDVKLSSGGLVTALSGLKTEIPFTWVGWPGQDFSGKDQIKVSQLLKQNSCVPVFLNDEVADLHYNGFSNSILWPLFHYHSSEIDFDKKAWDAYKQANEEFAKAVLEIVENGDLIWVHDYHLMLLCKLLQKEMIKCKKNVKIGWFLHTPFPSSEIYRILPVRKEILEGVLAADLIGFHTYDYARHFLSSCTRILGLPTNSNGIDFEGRKISVEIFPIGIDPKLFQNVLLTQPVKNRIAEFEDQFKGKRVIVGVDRLDYIKGVPQKFMAYQHLLKTHPEYVGKVVFVQVAVPSRGDVEQYQELMVNVNELVGLINGKYGTVEYTPIHFLHKSVDLNELTSLYAISDICLVTSTRDGMNLVSYEYVACQKKRNGVLILKVAETLHKALSMSAEVKASNYEKMSRYVNKHTAAYWGVSFVSALKKLTSSNIELSLKMPVLTPKTVASEFMNAVGIRPIIINYDGTLIPTHEIPDFAAPTKQVLHMLRKLVDTPNTVVYILSGRTRTQLERWFEGIDVGMVAEYGCFYRHPTKIQEILDFGLIEDNFKNLSFSPQRNSFIQPIQVDNSWYSLSNYTNSAWYDSVLPLFHYYTERTPGSFIEMKEINVTWHYRMAETEFGLFQANELQINLEKVLAHLPVSVLVGNKTLEVYPTSIGTAYALRYILDDISNVSPEMNFLLLGCSNKQEESIFNYIKQSPWSNLEHLMMFTVGRKQTEAEFYVKNVSSLYEILFEISDSA
ncbi:hypothetical protein BB558_004296 [Smittium angustum]|uniref:Uncharacterized protein n=1 Tax=Smittium angustum TaxID=133377 RepID=A0A2U1J3U7_SMIAN|nr:hypothetical protein BB558_005620 [Smittium angustum]PVZ99652.1 hypothetical protein BB558_004296 [Smittium angustum]